MERRLWPVARAATSGIRHPGPRDVGADILACRTNMADKNVCPTGLWLRIAAAVGVGASVAMDVEDDGFESRQLVAHSLPLLVTQRRTTEAHTIIGRDNRGQER